jgi:peptide/nickel transport system permease protein
VNEVKFRARTPLKAPFAIRLLRNSPLAIFGVATIAFNILMAISASSISPYDPYAMQLGNKLQGPDAAHIFGTDQLGRDILTRVIWGSRVSFEIGVVVVALSLFVGIPLGLVSGYAGGWLDEGIMRVTDIFLAFPALVLAIFIQAAIGPGLTNAMFSIAIVSWPTYARLVRGSAMSIKQNEFIEAARAVGEGKLRILFRHIFPNVLSPITVQSTLDMGGAVLTAAGLSFIGFGVQPPTAEWGAMVSTGRDYIAFAWWMTAFPGLAIFLFVLGFNLLGDWLNDFLNPRLRGVE